MVFCTAAAGDVHIVFNRARLKLTRWTDKGRMKNNNPCLQASSKSVSGLLFRHAGRLSQQPNRLASFDDETRIFFSTYKLRSL